MLGGVTNKPKHWGYKDDRKKYEIHRFGTLFGGNWFRSFYDIKFKPNKKSKNYGRPVKAKSRVGKESRYKRRNQWTGKGRNPNH